MNQEKDYTAAILVIGNEVLSGRTRDANIQFLGGRLAAMGIRVREARVIPDETPVIVEAVNGLRAAHDYLFTTGGIGPTHDDITAAAVAEALGRPLVRDDAAVAMLKQHYREADLNAARLKMADVPQGAVLIENPVSRAPGFQVENVFVLAGVPMIVEAMFDQLKDRLRGGRPVESRTVSTFTPEGGLAEDLGRVQESHPTVEVGSYPFVQGGRLGVSVVVRGPDPAALEAAAAAVRDLMHRRGAEPADGPRPVEEKG